MPGVRETLAARIARMRGAAFALLIAAAIALAGSATAATNPPRRIVSLAPAVTETLFALGAGGEVVGVSQYCDYPPEVAYLPRVGSFLTPNVEAIAGLRPDLIIGPGLTSSQREVRALQTDRKSTRLNSSHRRLSRMPSSA